MDPNEGVPNGPVVDAATLDECGRCCGRKPLVYKREPHRFCPKCDRAFSLTDPHQIQNWAYVYFAGGFQKVYP